MTFGTSLNFSMGRLGWVHDFAARLLEFGVPASTDALVALGNEWYDTGTERDPVRAAELAWIDWPTEQ
jgi:hypothetical protein